MVCGQPVNTEVRSFQGNDSGLTHSNTCYRPGVNPPSTNPIPVDFLIPNPIPVDFLIPNPIPVNLAMIPNPIPVIFPSAIPTPIPISSYWYEIIVREFRISHKTAQVKGPDWLKTSQTEVSL